MLNIAIVTTDGRSLSSQWAGEPAPSFGAAPRALLEGFAPLPDTRVHVLSAARDHSHKEMRLHDNVFWHPYRIGKYDQMRSLYAGSVLSCRKLLAAIDPQLVHGQGTEKDCALCAVHSGLPNVVTIHGNMAELHRLGYHGTRLFGAAASMLEGHTLRLTGGVFCNSAYTESLVQQRARRTWRVPNPIRSAFFQQPTGMPDSDVPCLLNVGLVTPRKRQLELLQSLRRLRNAGHTFKIIFVGGHSENSEYGKRFGAELKAAEKEGSAEYAGYLDVEELVPLMDRCSGFIHFPMEEAFGLVVAEAMARGLKFFGADLGGIRDIAAGIPGAELHDTMEELQGGIASWLRAGAPRFPDAAREMRNRYHPQVIAARHVEIYREMLER